MADEHKYEDLERDALFTILSETERLANVGGWEWDIVIDAWTFSDNWLRIHGCSKRHLATSELLPIAHPDDRQDIQQAFERAVNEGVKYEIEHRIIRQDTGEERYVRALGKPKLNSDGNTVKLYGSVQDITEKIMAEQSLKESEKRLKISTESGGVGLWELNLIDLTAWRSLTHDRIFGYESLLPEWTYEMFLDHVVEEDRPMVEEEFGKALKNRELWDFNCRINRKDGVSRWIHAKGKPEIDENQNPIKMYGTIQDVTERKRLEAASERERQLLQKAEQISNLGAWEWDIVNDRFKVSENWKELHGIDIDRMSSKELYTLAHPDDVSEIEALSQKVFQKEIPIYDHVHRIIRKNDGVTRYVRALGEIVFDYDDKPSWMYGTTQDITEQKRAEEAVKESEEKFRALFEQTGGYCMILDPNTSDGIPLIIDANEAACAAHGFTHEEFIGLPVAEIDDEEGKRLVKKHTAEIMKGEPFCIENTHIRKDGTSFPVEVNAKRINLSNGKSLILTTEYDITERKRAERQLIESQERFELAMEASRDGLYDWNLITNEIYYSPGWKHMLGYQANELPNDFSIWEELTEPEDVRKSWIMQQELINRERDRFELELKMKHKDGHWVDILSRATAVFDDDGKAVRIIGTHVDITERKKHEKQLKTLNSAIENSLNGFDIVNAEGVLIYANKAFVTMYGYDRAEEIIGNSPADLCVDPQLPTKVIQKLQESGEYEFEHVAKRKDGSTFDVLMYARLAHDEQGNEIYPTSCIDITERQKALIEKEQLERQLQQAHKMESIGTLAGGIAHDFNNILGAILGYAEMAQEGSPAGSMVRKDIDQVVKASHRAKDLVKQILSFSRQAETDYIPLQPDVIIKEALKMLRSSLPTTIDIQQDIDPETGPILADPTQIHQIINNLCTNAFHAMEETGGTLTISLKNKTLTLVDLVSEPHVEPGHFVEIIVGDTGPGIALENIDKIFDPFFTTKEVGKGTGMGLAIIHGIAKKSGGFVSCKSSPGQGATFIVYLPVHTVPASPEAETTPLELTQAGIERILFIDDDEMLAEMGKTMLERLGYRVTVETNSIEALKTIQSQPDLFDLVITDQTMPGMTGSDLARRILQIRPKLPIILCTGFSNQISEEKAKIYGIKGFAMKPLAMKDLATLVRKVLDGEKPKEQ